MMLRALQWERRAAARARLREMGERALRPLALAGAMFLAMRAEILPGMPPLALALMAVQTQTTEILSQFPTKAAKEPAKKTEAEEIPLF